MSEYTVNGLMLKCQNVTHGYGNLQKPIVRNVNCEIRDVKWREPHGQATMVVGPSGIGKSTLIEMLCGIMKPDQGAVLYGENGTPVKAGMVGLVDQDCTLFPDDKVIVQLSDAARLQYGTSVAYEKACQYLEKFGLDHRRNAYPAELSGGERQRVALLLPFLAGKEIICLDEPTSKLDFLRTIKLCEFLYDLLKDKEKLTLLMITHNFKFAAIMGDFILCLGYEKDEQGKKIAGATIVETVNLLDEDLEYHPEIAYEDKLIRFATDLEKKMVDRFRH